jgi:outer membrane lipoprotein-sorting protein
MFLSTPVKIFHVILIFPLIFTGCGGSGGNENTAMRFGTPELKEFPFSSREPDVFQTEMVIVTGGIERRIFIARNGSKRRIDYDVGTDNQRAIITTDRQYILNFKRSVYTERELSSSLGDLYEPSVAHVLNLREYDEFREADRDGSIVQYQAKPNESEVSEATIYFDESIGMPVKIEFYGLENDERKLEYSVELRDFRNTVDDAVFNIPNGFKKSVGR